MDLQLFRAGTLVRRRFLGMALALSGSACSGGTGYGVEGGVDGVEPEIAAVESTLAGDVLTSQRPVFAGIWNPSTSGQFVGLSRNYDQFIAEYGTWWNKGYRLISLTTNVVDGQVLYSGVWNPSTSGQFVGLGRNYDQFIAEYGTWWNNGFRLIALTTNVVNGTVLYNGVWNPSTAGQFLGVGRTFDQFVAEYNTWAGKGFRLAAMSTFVQNDVVYYSGIWNPGNHAQFMGLARPEAEFVSTYGDQWGKNMRLAALATDHVESLAINRVADGIKTALTNNAVGFTATVAHGSQRARASGGLRRTASDSPARSASTSARVNVASVSKTATAVGVLQLLRAKGLTASSKVSSYLPSDWSKGTNVSSITFGELLSHTSGIRGANANATSYTDLKTLIANGVKLADKVYSYQNQNFALFRVIIPYLNGFNESGVTDKDGATSTAYMNYMNTKVFTPAGISTVAMKPAASEPTLCYPFPAGNVKGNAFGDWTRTGGGAGLHLSTDDLATFLVKLRDGTLLPASWNTTMDTGRFGWQDITPVRHGSVAWHGGYLFFPTPSNGAGELNALVLSFSNGTQIGVEVNSRSDADIWQSAVNAYNNSWVPITQ